MGTSDDYSTSYKRWESLKIHSSFSPVITARSSNDNRVEQLSPLLLRYSLNSICAEEQLRQMFYTCACSGAGARCASRFEEQLRQVFYTCASILIRRFFRRRLHSVPECQGEDDHDDASHD